MAVSSFRRRSGVIHTAAARTFIGLEVITCHKLLAEYPAAFTRDLNTAWARENRKPDPSRAGLIFTILPSVKGSHVSPRLRVYCDWQNRDSSIVIVGKYETWLRSFRVLVLFCSAEKSLPLRWGCCGDSTAFGTNRIWRFFISQVVVTARFTQNLIISLALHPAVSLTLRFVRFLIQLSAWPLDLFLFSCFCFFFPAQ